MIIFCARVCTDYFFTDHERKAVGLTNEFVFLLDLDFKGSDRIFLYNDTRCAPL